MTTHGHPHRRIILQRVTKAHEILEPKTGDTAALGISLIITALVALACTWEIFACSALLEVSRSSVREVT